MMPKLMTHTPGRMKFRDRWLGEWRNLVVMIHLSIILISLLTALSIAFCLFKRTASQCVCSQASSLAVSLDTLVVPHPMYTLVSLSWLLGFFILS